MIMRSLDVLLAFPSIVLVFLFMSMVGVKLWLLVLLVGTAWIAQVARVTRGITLETVTKEFIDAAELIGIPRRQILIGEVLPNLTSPLMVEYGLRLTWSIGVIAALSFIGYGIQPPNADWGLMINENRSGLLLTPWPTVVPIAMIALFTIGTNLITEGIARTVAGIEPPRRRRGKIRAR
jgi:peptide/nickel transport system permease protein